jgi:hypothetical protein
MENGSASEDNLDNVARVVDPEETLLLGQLPALFLLGLLILV